jgi:hypothetical protein
MPEFLRECTYARIQSDLVVSSKQVELDGVLPSPTPTIMPTNNEIAPSQIEFPRFEVRPPPNDRAMAMAMALTEWN